MVLLEAFPVVVGPPSVVVSLWIMVEFITNNIRTSFEQGGEFTFYVIRTSIDCKLSTRRPL